MLSSHSQFIHLLATELNLYRTNILTNRPKVLTNPLATQVHFLWVHTILGMQVLNFPIGKHSIELVLDLVL